MLKININNEGSYDHKSLQRTSRVNSYEPSHIPVAVHCSYLERPRHLHEELENITSCLIKTKSKITVFVNKLEETMTQIGGLTNKRKSERYIIVDDKAI